MLRAIPKSLTRDMLHDTLAKEGFGQQVDFIYVPTDFKSGLGFGYSFVNLVTHEAASECQRKFQGFLGWPLPWEKPCDASSGDGCQGVDEHVERYRNSPVMHDSIPDSQRPAIYSKGVRQPFPKPTQCIDEPKMRARKPTPK